MKVAMGHLFAKIKHDICVYPEENIYWSKCKEDPHFEAVLKTVHRWWQGIKNRQEGLTKTMVATLCQKHTGNAWDSHNQSLVNWLVVSLHRGYHRCEWAQEEEVSGKQSEEFQIIKELPGHPTYAVLPTDIVFVDQGYWQLLCRSRAQIAAVKVISHFQKNGNLGQTVTFLANTLNCNFCIVWAFLNVFPHCSALGVDPAFPLPVYGKYPGSQQASWFTMQGITKMLKALAAEVYSDKADLAAMIFTPHSLLRDGGVRYFAPGKS
jgi:hypothetical protein